MLLFANIEQGNRSILLVQKKKEDFIMAKNHYGKNSYNAQNADNCMVCHDTFQNNESDKTSNRTSNKASNKASNRAKNKAANKTSNRTSNQSDNMTNGY